MRGALGGPRVLLRRLREVMAEPVSAQERLDKIVVLIAANMVAEVCSVYVLRVDGTLELYATEGLNRQAVHQTVLRSDEGLVGLVASEANAINLSALAPPGAEPAARRTLHLSGTALNDGIALGHVVLHEPRVVITNYIAEDLPKEVKRLDTALAKLRADLDRMLERGDVAEGGEHRDVLEAYRMFANDHGWAHKLEEAVMTGLTAEAAVERVQSDTRARMLRQTDPYLRERLHDFDDLANRLLRQLLGRDHAPSRENLPENAVIVARSMGPAALLDYDRKRLRGVILEESGPTSHVAIVARALGIAAVGEIANAIGLVDPGDAIIVDGALGEVHIRPAPDLEAAYVERVRLRARRQLQYFALRDKPCVTRDGEDVMLLINAGLLVDLPHIVETGAAGIGLFRTELQFMVASQFPRTGEQLALYRAVLDASAGRPVTFRTLDIGGDKVLPYMRNIEEENPALGWRAIRLGLDRPGLLRSQVRALLRAAGGRELRLMFPMIAMVEEFDKAKSLVEVELTHLRRHGHPLPERVQIGTMLEVPALLFQLDELLERVDFLSVGSNDLMQFLYAADRGNARVSQRFDPLSAPVLRALKDIADKSRKHGKPVALCGELASQPIGALALAILGYRSLSLSPSAVGPVKALLLDLDCRKGETAILPFLEQPVGSVSIRHKLEGFAAAEGLQL